MFYKNVQNMKFSQITLGTAQLGMNYGISNKVGKPSVEYANQILTYAINSGINSFDTAQNYGSSETLLGNYFHNNNNTVNIITKIPKINFDDNNSIDDVYNKIRMNVLLSLQKLQINKIPVYLLHDPIDITEHDGITIRSLIKLKNEGLIKKIGAVIHNPDDVNKFLSIGEFDAIHIPINLFDLRLMKSGLLDELIKKQIIIFARSIFLQGLFFLKPNEIPTNLAHASKYIQKLNDICSDLNTEIEELALTFVKELSGITSMVVGVESVNQLDKNIKILEKSTLHPNTKEIIMKNFSSTPENVINPNLWTTDKNEQK